MEELGAKNIVSLEPEGYIYVALVGDQNYRSIDKTAQQAERIAERLKGEGKPILGVIDSSQHKAFDTGSNKAAMEALERIPYQRVALCGTNKILTGVATAIIAALGKNDRTKLFVTREEAVAWVLNDPVL